MAGFDGERLVVCGERFVMAIERIEHGAEIAQGVDRTVGSSSARRRSVARPRRRCLAAAAGRRAGARRRNDRALRRESRHSAFPPRRASRADGMRRPVRRLPPNRSRDGPGGDGVAFSTPRRSARRGSCAGSRRAGECPTWFDRPPRRGGGSRSLSNSGQVDLLSSSLRRMDGKRRGIGGELQRQRLVVFEARRHQFRQAGGLEHAGPDPAGKGVAQAGDDRQPGP